jgi:TetR/AcrR family transcriptional regulator
MNPKPSFARLSSDKQREILEVAMDEFIEQGYRNASTNRVVGRLGIAKGSLFNYFGSKERLYLYLLYRAGRELLELVEARYREMPSDLCDRLRRVAETTLEFYESNPRLYRFFTQFAESAEIELQRRYAALFAPEEQRKIFYNLFQGVDTSHFRFDPERTFMLTRWLFAGLKLDLAAELNASRDARGLKTKLLGRLDVALEALKAGIYREPAREPAASAREVAAQAARAAASGDARKER